MQTSIEPDIIAEKVIKNDLKTDYTENIPIIVPSKTTCKFRIEVWIEENEMPNM